MHDGGIFNIDLIDMLSDCENFLDLLSECTCSCGFTSSKSNNEPEYRRPKDSTESYSRTHALPCHYRCSQTGKYGVLEVNTFVLVPEHSLTVIGQLREGGCTQVLQKPYFQGS